MAPPAEHEQVPITGRLAPLFFPVEKEPWPALQPAMRGPWNCTSCRGHRQREAWDPHPRATELPTSGAHAVGLPPLLRASGRRAGPCRTPLPRQGQGRSFRWKRSRKASNLGRCSLQKHAAGGPGGEAREARRLVKGTPEEQKAASHAPPEHTRPHAHSLRQEAPKALGLAHSVDGSSFHERRSGCSQHVA